VSEIVYKLKHVPTGLYFDPRGCTVNASVLGRVFSGRKPPRQNFWGVDYTLKDDYDVTYKKTALSEWEVVEFELTEVNK